MTTLAQSKFLNAQAAARELNVNITRNNDEPGEFRVRLRSAGWFDAYYTKDLADALAHARLLSYAR